MLRSSHVIISLVWTIFLALSFDPNQAASVPAATKEDRKGGSCSVRVSAWNDCSKLCGMGSSTRVKMRSCRMRRETRLCMIRPCQGNGVTSSWQHGKRQCVANIRESKRRHLEYIGSKSEKRYRMRFCGGCKKTNKCCKPHKTKTRRVWFRRANGQRFSKKMMFIRKCRCTTKCPLSGFDVPQIALFNDTLQATAERSDGKRSTSRT